MNVRQELSLEQQFELQVFEGQVRQLSQEDAQDLLVKLREAMMYQAATFREVLKEAWGIGEGIDVTRELLSES
ncbi:MAG: NblA/ycf18 family protein [Cyanobacteria bacterium P01_F01_bin.86]